MSQHHPPNLGSALRKDLVYPLHFVDFEAPREPLPRFPNQHPYDVVPFQWSCHTINGPGAEPEHTDYLEVNPVDPRPAFAERSSTLCKTLHVNHASSALSEPGLRVDRNPRGCQAASRLCRR